MRRHPVLKIKQNPNITTVTEVRRALAKNDGYCPCRLNRTPDTKCICKEFREQNTEGMCHCGLYIKEEIK